MNVDESLDECRQVQTSADESLEECKQIKKKHFFDINGGFSKQIFFNLLQICPLEEEINEEI